jgi:MFS family permease
MPPTPVHSDGAEKLDVLAILKQRSALGTCLTLFCMNYYSYFMLTWLPYYLLEERHFTLRRMSEVAASMFLCAAVASAVFGRLSDRWIAQGGTPTRVRKGVMAVSTAFTGTVVAGAAFAPDSIAIVLLLLAGAGFGATASNTWAITQRLAGPRAVGRWTGLQLFVGNLAGVVAPALTGFIVQRTGQFYGPFLVVAAISWVGSLAWLYAIGPIEPVSWDAAPAPSNP